MVEYINDRVVCVCVCVYGCALWYVRLAGENLSVAGILTTQKCGDEL